MSRMSTFLKRELDKRGWSVPQLAEQSGIPYPTLAHYTNPKYRGKPNHENIIQLAAALEVGEDYILRQIGYPIRHSNNNDEREQRWAKVRTLLESDERAARILEIFEDADDEEKDGALTLLETYFSRPRRPRRRQ